MPRGVPGYLALASCSSMLFGYVRFVGRCILCRTAVPDDFFCCRKGKGSGSGKGGEWEWECEWGGCDGEKCLLASFLCMFVFLHSALDSQCGLIIRKSVKSIE